MGPQHPMTHGIWNMKVKVDGETITDAKPEIGYLHRGYEKIMEVREFQKNVVLTDRLCYVSSITWSHAYCLAVEKMMGIETPERGQWIRVIALELQRVASHLMWLASYGPDLGLLTGLLWCLRERELFLDLIQLMSGARMNQNYPRVGGVRNDLPENFEAMCKRSIEHFLEKMPKTGPYRVKPPRRAEGEGYAKTEDSRGEALFFVIGDGDDRPYRVKIRSPVFCTMAATPQLLRGNKLADVVSILGSVDVCVGEMDK